MQIVSINVFAQKITHVQLAEAISQFLAEAISQFWVKVGKIVNFLREQ
jgi:hypothetical protein